MNPRLLKHYLQVLLEKSELKLLLYQCLLIFDWTFPEHVVVDVIIFLYNSSH